MSDLSFCWRKVEWKFEGDFEGRCSHTSTVVGNKIYVIGGGFCTNDLFTHHDDVIVMNPSLGTGARIENDGNFTPRRGHTAVMYQERYIIVFGGVGGLVSGSIGDDLTNDLFVFDCISLTWTHRNSDGQRSWPPARRGHFAVIYENKMIIAGGDCAVNSDFSKAYVLDLETWRWTICQCNGSCPPCISLAASGRIDNQVLVFAGTTLQDGFGRRQYARFRSLNLDTFEWRDISHLLDWSEDPAYARFGVASAMLFREAAMIVFGGTMHDIGSITNLNELLVLQLSEERNRRHQSLSMSGAEWGSRQTSGSPSQLLFHGRRAEREPVIGIDIPCVRNGATLTAFSPTAYILIGGGIFPTSYFDDVWILEIVTMPRLMPALGSAIAAPKDRDSSQRDIFRPLTRSSLHCDSTISHSGSLGNEARAWDSMKRYFESLLEDDRYADVAFELDSGDVVRGHRIVLAARCEYFRVLLDGSFGDKSGCISDEKREKLMTVSHDIMKDIATRDAESDDCSSPPGRVVSAACAITESPCLQYEGGVTGKNANEAEGSKRVRLYRSDEVEVKDCLRIRLQSVGLLPLEWIKRFLYGGQLRDLSTESIDFIWELLACASMLDITAIKQHCESTIGEMIRIDGRGVFTFAGHTLLPLKLSPYADTTPEWASSTSSFARHCEASGAGGCVAAGSLSLGGTSEATAACSWENVEKCVCDVLQVIAAADCYCCGDLVHRCLEFVRLLHLTSAVLEAAAVAVDLLHSSSSGRYNHGDEYVEAASTPSLPSLPPLLPIAMATRRASTSTGEDTTAIFSRADRDTQCAGVFSLVGMRDETEESGERPIIEPVDVVSGGPVKEATTSPAVPASLQAQWLSILQPAYLQEFGLSVELQNRLIAIVEQRQCLLPVA